MDEYPILKGIFKEGTEVLIPELHYESGVVLGIVDKQYLIKLDDDTILLPEYSLEFADLLDTPIDTELIYEESDLLAKSNSRNKYKWTLPDGIPIIGKPKLPHLIFCVGSDEGPIPHAHIFRTKEDSIAWFNGACLILNKNMYFDHAHNDKSLTNRELNSVIAKLSQLRNDTNRTWWDEVIVQWNKINDFKIPSNLPMPSWNDGHIKRMHE